MYNDVMTLIVCIYARDQRLTCVKTSNTFVTKAVQSATVTSDLFTQFAVRDSSALYYDFACFTAGLP